MISVGTAPIFTVSAIFIIYEKGYFIMTIEKTFQKIMPDLFQSAFDKILSDKEVYFKKNSLSESKNLQEYWRVFAMYFASALNDMFYSRFKSLPNVLDVVLVELDTQSKCVYSYQNNASSSFDLDKSRSDSKSENQCIMVYDIGFKIPLRKGLSKKVLDGLKQEYDNHDTYTAQFIYVICPTTREQIKNSLFNHVNHNIEYSIFYDEENESLNVRIKSVQ